jgi:hypothetical protein
VIRGPPLGILVIRQHGLCWAAGDLPNLISRALAQRCAPVCILHIVAAPRHHQPLPAPSRYSSPCVHPNSAGERSRWPADSVASAHPLSPRCAVFPFFTSFLLPRLRALLRDLSRALRTQARLPASPPSGLRSLQKNRAKDARFFGSPAKAALGAGSTRFGRPADAGQKGTENVFQ